MTFTLFEFSRRPAFALLTCFAFALICSHVAYAQTTEATTEEKLDDNAVEKIGAKYPEVKNAITFFRAGDVDRTRALLIAAKKNHADLPPADAMLAQLLFAANQAPLGRDALERAVIAEPEAADTYVMLGQLARWPLLYQPL